MRSIKVINPIRISPKGVLVKDANGKYRLHKRQGNMDGACAVYSLSMALLCIGAVTEEDLDIFNKPDRRTPKGKLLSHFLDEQGMIRYGYNYSTLAKEFNKQNFGIRATRKKTRETTDLLVPLQICLMRINWLLYQLILLMGLTPCLLLATKSVIRMV